MNQKPADESDLERLEKAYQCLCEEAGFKIQYIRWPDLNMPEGCIVCELADSDLTFDMLRHASEVMGTRKIFVSCDLGCSSDRSHDTTVSFHGPSNIYQPPKSDLLASVEVSHDGTVWASLKSKEDLDILAGIPLRPSDSVSEALLPWRYIRLDRGK